MKKTFVTLTLALGVLCCGALSACTPPTVENPNNNNPPVVTPEKKEYTVRFVQEGQDDVVRKVEENSALTDIPTPVAVTGYDVAWDVNDFTNITQDMVVNAVKTAKTYLISYDLGVVEGDVNAVISTKTQEVKFDEQFTLVTPSCVRYIFKRWVITGTETVFESGTYTMTENVSLTAIWEINEDDMWTGQH